MEVQEALCQAGFCFPPTKLCKNSELKMLILGAHICILWARLLPWRNQPRSKLSIRIKESALESSFLPT